MKRFLVLVISGALAVSAVLIAQQRQAPQLPAPSQARPNPGNNVARPDGAMPKVPAGFTVDVYFDNTGGPVLEAALSLMNLRGRIVCCGNVSQYDVEKPAPGPMAVPGLVVTKRLRLEGFVVMDFFDQRAEAEARLARWVEEGKIKAIVDIVDGLDKAPQALIGLFEGRNKGKMAVRV